jgi:hypothetical protein
MDIKKKANKGLSDQELVTKYEAGQINLAASLKQTFQSSQAKCAPEKNTKAKK